MTRCGYSGSACLTLTDTGKGVARRVILSGVTCMCRTVLVRVWETEGQPIQGLRVILWTIAVKRMKDWRLRPDWTHILQFLNLSSPGLARILGNSLAWL